RNGGTSYLGDLPGDGIVCIGGNSAIHVPHRRQAALAVISEYGTVAVGCVDWVNCVDSIEQRVGADPECEHAPTPGLLRRFPNPRDTIGIVSDIGGIRSPRLRQPWIVQLGHAVLRVMTDVSATADVIVRHPVISSHTKVELRAIWIGAEPGTRGSGTTIYHHERGEVASRRLVAISTALGKYLGRTCAIGDDGNTVALIDMLR